jgi:hypothetical protein
MADAGCAAVAVVVAAIADDPEAAQRMAHSKAATASGAIGVRVAEVLWFTRVYALEP